MFINKNFLSFLITFSIFCTVYSQGISKHLPRDNYNSFNNFPKLTESALTVNRYDFTITLRDGIKIDAVKFIPVGTPPTGGWPTVIMVHGYGDNKETLAGFCMAQAEYGYYTATFSVRGQGKSGGLSNLISTTEAQDLVEFVTAIKRDSVNGSNPNRILIMGGSQGGLLPMMAASRYDMNVKTIISALAPSNFATSWIENGCIKMTFLWTIEYTPDTARYTPLVDRMSNWVYASTSKPYWDSLAYWLPLNRDFTNYVSKTKMPVMIEGSWQDKFFNAYGLINEVNLITSPCRTYLGAVQGHGGDHSDTEDKWHMQFFNDWFFTYLLDQQPPSGSKYEYASTSYPLIYPNKWTFTHGSSDIPFTSMTTGWRLYFNKSGQLKTTANATADSVTLKNPVSGGLTMQEAVNEEFTGPTFTSKFTKNSLTFTSATLTQNYKMLGTPKINMQYSSTAGPFCQYNFQIYEVKPDGSQWLVNRLNYTDRNYSRNTRRIAKFIGDAHSHIFTSGNKIRLVLTNLDTSPADTSFMSTNPFVLPILISQNNKLFLNSNSYIEIPIIPNSTETAFEPQSEQEYILGGNYPNPFNPETTIKFELKGNEAVKAEVKLIIYNLIGQEVATLINGSLSHGLHEARWNASNYSSGIYFYSLIVNGIKIDTKKMLLVK